jgi:hypothetical protein
MESTLRLIKKKKARFTFKNAGKENKTIKSMFVELNF